METGIRILLLSVVLALSGCASIRNWLDRDEPKEDTSAQADTQADTDDVSQAPPRVIEPEVAEMSVAPL